MKTVYWRAALATALVFAAGAGAQVVWNGSAETVWFTSKPMASKFTISAAEQLAGLASLVNSGQDMSGKTFTLDGDIALNVTTDWQNWGVGGSGDNPWTPIGTSENPFAGRFDGGGFVVRGVFNDDEGEPNRGLFGCVRGGRIENLRVIDSYIGAGDSVGVLVGKNDGGRIINCYTNGKVGNGNGAANNIGGLVGWNRGTIDGSYATGAVLSDGGSYIGGLVGFSAGDTIRGCYATGAVRGGEYVGGLVGNSMGRIIINSYARGDVFGAGGFVGGLVGGSKDTIMNSCAIGNVSSATVDYVGGLVGEKSAGAIKNCYAAGDVLTVDSSNMGGKLLGGPPPNDVAIIYGHYNSEAYGKDDNFGNPRKAGEMKGKRFAELLNAAAYAFKSSSGAPLAYKWVYSEGEYPTLGGLITEADFIACFASGSNNDRGRLTLLIDTLTHLENLAAHVNCGADLGGGTVKLGRSIILNQDTANWQEKCKDSSKAAMLYSWEPIGQRPNGDALDRWNMQFNGTFDGGGHVISGVYINKTAALDADRYQGLFGKVGPDGTVKNLGIAAAYVNGYSYVGMLAGWNSGKIERCYAFGNVSATHGDEGGTGIGGLVGVNAGGYAVVTKSRAEGTVGGIINMAGGLVGWNSAGARVEYSYAVVDVSVAGDDVGGLVGRNDGDAEIMDCYAAGNVEAERRWVNSEIAVGGSSAGGLVGINFNAAITRGYAIGEVKGNSSVGGLVGFNTGSLESIAASFYKIDPNMPENAYGIRATDSLMKDSATYIAKGWKFNNATVPVWDMDAEVWSYPFINYGVRATKPVNVRLSIGDTAVARGARLTITVTAEGSPANDGRLSYQWYSSTVNQNSGGTEISGATSASYSVPTDKNVKFYYYAIVTNTIKDNNDGGQKSKFVASNAVKVTVGGPDAVLSWDRVVPAPGSDREAAFISPVAALTAGFAAGPNPVAKHGHGINIYRKGKKITTANLLIYDAYGNAVSKVKIEERRNGSLSPAVLAGEWRVAGSWDLTDGNGRPVPAGTYLIKGAVTVDGKKENVSILVGVR